MEHLRRHKYIRRFHPQPPPPPPSAPEPQDPHSNSTGPNPGLPDPLLPPAGSVLVYDKDCSELFDRLRPPSGFYRIRPKLDQEPDWVDYRDGFGDFKKWNDEFWLGNEHIHVLLSEGQNLLKIDLTDWSGQTNHAFYQNFRIGNEKDSYRLQYGQYSGRAGDALTAGGGVEQWSACVNGMHAANLNGKFYRSGEYKGGYDNGVVWGTWRGLWYSLRHTAMKFRPLTFLDSAGSGDG
ncbi:hypothetical protein CRUP_036093 [Coryphaenoides rupestris]|nr:hypothetical protein CRUP_036093 [Coryphaenoides rupestris]